MTLNVFATVVSSTQTTINNVGFAVARTGQVSCTKIMNSLLPPPPPPMGSKCTLHVQVCRADGHFCTKIYKWRDKYVRKVS